MSDSQENEEKNESNQEEKEPQISEIEISRDKYEIIPDNESNIITDKIIQVLQEKLLQPIEKFNIDLIIKNDTEKMFDKESLEQIEIEIENFKKSFIELQFKNIKDLISKFSLVENLKDFSEEKTFAEELKSYDIDMNIFSFIGPLSAKIEELNKKEKKDNSQEIIKALFKILEMNYYKNQNANLENSINEYNLKINELNNKNNIFFD